MLARRLPIALLFVAACGGGSIGDDANDDTSDALFDPDHLLEVAVTMDPADFDALRNETRSIPETLEGDCLAQPFASPFNTYHADVNVDGVDYADVAIKKKGFFGSGLGPPTIAKPALKLDADKFVADQRFGGPGGLDKLVLNNSVQDPSYVRTCLGYDVFRAAGVPAPRCAWAHVTVNGEDLGAYVHVEDVDGQFLARNFDDPSGALYKGILSDFRTGWDTSFDLQEGTEAPQDLADLTAAAEGPDAQLLAGVEARVDFDPYLTMWAAESLLRHWDGYNGNTNNFFVYDDPATGRFQFLPWGTDQVMQNGTDAPASVYGTGVLAQRLYHLPEVATQYVDRMNELLDTAWDESAIHAEIDRAGAMLAPYTGDLGPQLDDVRAFVDGRRAVIANEIAGGPPAMPVGLRGSFCIAPIGSISGTYATTWGTGAADPWSSGTGTLTATNNGTPLAFTGMYGAVADLDTNDTTKAQIILFATETNGRVAAAVLSFLATRVLPGTELGIDWSPTYAAILEYDPGPQTWTNLGTFGIGHITIDHGRTVAATPVDGSFSADLVIPPW